MSNEPEGNDSPPVEEGWVQVGKAPPPASLADVPAEDDRKPFESRQPRPPWKYSVYTGVAGLVLMLALYIFPDLRRFETPWDRSFPAVYTILVFPVFALIWGLAGALGKPYRADAGRAIAGIVLALITFGVAYAIIAAGGAAPAESVDAIDERLQLSPEELKQWRSDKLRQ